MAEEKNIVLEQLRYIRATVDRIESEHGDRLSRIELRLSGVESYVGHLVTQGAADREAVQSLARRVERIERRLQLRENDDA